MQRPAGFSLLGVILFMILWRWIAMLSTRAPLDATQSPVVTVLHVVLVALVAVSIEALWRVRPWCARAYAAAIATLVLKQLAIAVAERGAGLRLQDLLAVAWSAALPVASAVYVHFRAKALFNPAPLRRTPPRVPLRHGSILPPQTP
jgi:hypothetical protein